MALNLWLNKIATIIKFLTLQKIRELLRLYLLPVFHFLLSFRWLLNDARYCLVTTACSQVLFAWWGIWYLHINDAWANELIYITIHVLPFPFFKIKWTLYMACWNLLLLNMISLICFRQRIAKLILDLWRETGRTYLQCLPCRRLVCQNRRDCRPEPGVCCSLWTMSLVFKYDNRYPYLSPVWKYDGSLVDYTVLYIKATFHGWSICGELDHTTILMKESNF